MHMSPLLALRLSLAGAAIGCAGEITGAMSDEDGLFDQESSDNPKPDDVGPEDEDEDDNVPGDYDGDGDPYNGEDGAPVEVDDYTTEEDYSTEPGAPDDSEDDNLSGGSDAPAALDSGSGNGAGDGTDGDVGNGEDNGV